MSSGSGAPVWLVKAKLLRARLVDLISRDPEASADAALEMLEETYPEVLG